MTSTITQPLSDTAIEAAIAAQETKAPRVTPQSIEALIVARYFFTADKAVVGAEYLTDQRKQSLSLLTFCVLVLKNGFTVTGESACASPERFDPVIGQQVAYKDAVDKVWKLEGYLLKEMLHQHAVR